MNRNCLILPCILRPVYGHKVSIVYLILATFLETVFLYSEELGTLVPLQFIQEAKEITGFPSLLLKRRLLSDCVQLNIFTCGLLPFLYTHLEFCFLNFHSKSGEINKLFKGANGNGKSFQRITLHVIPRIFVYASQAL